MWRNLCSTPPGYLSYRMPAFKMHCLSYPSWVLGPICRVMGPHRLLDPHRVIILRGAFSKVIITSGNIITFFTGTRYVQSQQWKQKNNVQAKFRPQQKHLKWSLKTKTFNYFANKLHLDFRYLTEFWIRL